MLKNRIFLLAILLIAGFLRFINLNSLPVTLNRDEAALAYNGYLLSETGKDEWGKSWSIFLESFGDYKLIGYPAILAALFKLAPTTDFWVRVPSALSGVGLVILGFWFARTLKLKKQTAILLALMLAITPVFIFYSRIAFEANVALFIFTLSLGLIFSDAGKPKIIKKVAILFCYLLSVLTYNTPLLLGIMFLPVIIFIYGYKNWRKWLPVILGWLIVSLGALLIMRPVFAQKQNITLFSDEASVLSYNEYRSNLPPALRQLVGNKVVYFSPQIVVNFLRSFSPRFLVTQGGSHPWHSLPNWGHIYWWQYILALLGLAFAAKIIVGSKNKRSLNSWQSLLEQPLKSERGISLILLLLLALSLVPSIITTDAPHATRSLLFFFLLLIFAALAFEKILKVMGKPTLIILFALMIISTIRFSQAYFVEYKNDQLMFQPGFSQIIDEIKQDNPNEKVAIVDSGGYQYILAAWYAHLTPEEYFSSVVRQAPNQIGFRYGQQVGQFHFIAQEADRSPEEIIFVEWTGAEWAKVKF
ncbi:MAG: hypothetical protein COY80_04720 [Candidatus Pacebacteria bacterium CG_4_10_14_0_8_um_filter_42_14]|nr:MAG: hypothetical protein COY80_04720 [Candidatus Pacebacteria bacterium CG_4_10_14_0_8_um_filter_42_14]